MSKVYQLKNGTSLQIHGCPDQNIIIPQWGTVDAEMKVPFAKILWYFVGLSFMPGVGKNVGPQNKIGHSAGCMFPHVECPHNAHRLQDWCYFFSWFAFLKFG